jgi:hypothetical protein
MRVLCKLRHGSHAARIALVGEYLLHRADLGLPLSHPLIFLALVQFAGRSILPAVW